MIPEVVKEILWTDIAKTSFRNITEYLRVEWSEREVEKFLMRTNETLITLKSYPEMCRPSLKRKNVRICILNKHTQLVYHYALAKRKITILLFWGIKQDPSKFKY